MKEKPKTVWKLAPKYRGKFHFDNIDLVNLFLNAVSYWFTEKENALYGKRAAVRRHLLYYLKHNDEPNGGVGTPKELIYALNKFQSEWIEAGGMFQRAI